MGKSIRVLLADDHPVLCAGLRSLISDQEDLSLVGLATTGEEAYELYRQLLPDVVVMDLNMPGIGGMESIRRIRSRDPLARIIVLSAHDSEVLVRQAVDAGIMGFITKSNDAATMFAAIRRVSDGQVYFSTDLLGRLTQIGKSPGGTPLDVLSPRELDIFKMVAEGQSVADISKTLSLSPKTVSNHLTRIKRKMDVSSNATLTRIAIRYGVIEA
jgi:two-component system, NarL family, invasion response regulator UvrY